MRNKMDDVTM